MTWEHEGSFTRRTNGIAICTSDEIDAGYDCPNPRLSLHTCPYKEDIYGDIGTLCACCVSCQNDCARDI